MTDETVMIDVMESRAKRREERRDLFRMLGGKALAGGTAALAATAATAQTAAPTDADILNFALNLEYLEAQFYSFAAFGMGLTNADLGGTGTRGEVVGGRQVAFQDPIVRQYAREIAADELAHVRFLRSAGALGSAAVAQPAIDIRGGVGSPFGNAAAAAGLPANFDPYASDNNFLLGAFIFEDVGVTAYKGASPLLTSRVFLEAAAGILAVEAYHAAIVRTVLYARGVATPSPADAGVASSALVGATEAISDARDSLDGTLDRDQGVRPIPTGAGAPAAQSATATNIVPLDANGIAFSRTGGQVLNVVYLNRAAVSQGGFFPAGVNGTIRTSAAS